jgi:hypothetical protein
MTILTVLLPLNGVSSLGSTVVYSCIPAYLTFLFSRKIQAFLKVYFQLYILDSDLLFIIFLFNSAKFLV